MMPAAVLSLLVKTEGATLAAAELKKLDRTAATTGKAFDRSADSAHRHSKMLGGLASVAKYGGAAMAGGLVVGLTKSISAFQESERVGKQTTAVLKSTGGAANVTKKHVENLATAISRKTGIDDEAIQSSENLLLTFTRVRDEAGKGNDIFTQATKTVQDMSIALGQDGKSSAIQLGKALNDPIKGVSALQRVGVTFTSQQKDQIKTLVTHGDTLKAQKIILKELNTEFGGSAAAAGSTFSGSMQKAKTAVGNLGETIGGALAPKLKDAADKLTKFVNQMQDGTGAGGRFVDKMKAVWEGLSKILGVVKDVAGWLGRHPALLKAAAGAWIAYKTAAVAQIAIVKAAELGLFGAGMKAKLATSAAATGTTVGRGFAAKAGLAAAAGIAGWEIGKWLRNNVPAVKSAGDFIGNTLGKAIYGRAKDQIEQLDYTLSSVIRNIGKQIAGIPKNVPKAPKKGTPLNKLPKLTKPNAPKKNVHGTSSAVTKIRAHASGEAGGQELGSLQSALAWVRSHYPGLLESMIEYPGGSNQHLHIASGNVVAIGKALQAMGYSVAENPAFGGVHPVHKPGSYHYKGLAIDVNADYRSIRAGGTAPGGGGGRAPAQAIQKTTKKAIDNAKKQAAVLKKAKRLAAQRKRLAAQRKHEAALERHRKNLATMRAAQTVNRTIDNPWLQAALTHTDNLVAAGRLTEAEGNALKAGYLTNALPSLVGENALIAEGMIRDLTAPAAAADTGTGEDPNQALIDAQDEANRLQEEANRLAEEQAAAMNALKDEVKRQTDFATSVANTESAAMARWVTEVISKQMGFGIAGRSQTPGYGVARRP